MHETPDSHLVSLALGRGLQDGGLELVDEDARLVRAVRDEGEGALRPHKRLLYPQVQLLKTGLAFQVQVIKRKKVSGADHTNLQSRWVPCIRVRSAARSAAGCSRCAPCSACLPDHAASAPAKCTRFVSEQQNSCDWRKMSECVQST